MTFAGVLGGDVIGGLSRWVSRRQPIDRYLINSTTEGLASGDDGSLVIKLQHDEPTDPAERANWLPAPEGDFYLMLRIYMPTEAVLDGTWEPPAVVKVSLT